MLIGYALLLILGIAFLIKGSDLFVDAGSEIGKTLKISELLIGITVVSIGTSLPELTVALMGAQDGSTGIALGNVLGTNMFNICIILAVIALIKPVFFKKETVRKDLYMSVVTALTLFIVMADKIIGGEKVNIISRTDGLILLMLFGIFVYYTAYPFITYWKEREEKKDEIKLKLKDIDSLTKNILLVVLGVTIIFLGANWAVKAVENIAIILGISETFISILVVAIGTSLPEVFTSLSAIKKNKPDIAVGNLIGSNMVNILMILGITSVIHPIALEMDSLIVDALVFFLVTVLLISHVLTSEKYKLTKWEGLSLVSIYVAYITYVIIRG